MKNRKIAIIVILGLLMISGQFCVVQSVSSSVQDRALAFIKNVLPIDSSKWNIEFKVDSNATGTREHLDMNNISASENDRILIYFLGSMVGTADSIEVIFIVRDSIFLQGVINIDNSPTYRQTYKQFVTPISQDDVTNFLVEYQSWSGLDSTKMVEMLSNVDLFQNTNISSGNLTMTINRMDDSTKIRWVFPDSRKFEVAYQNYFPTSFYDERQISSISTPTQTPTIPEFPTAIISIVLLLAITAATFFHTKNRIKKRNLYV